MDEFVPSFVFMSEEKLALLDDGHVDFASFDEHCLRFKSEIFALLEFEAGEIFCPLLKLGEYRLLSEDG